MTFQRLLIVATILTGLTAPVSAAHRLWGIAGSGDWSTGANWSGGVVPGIADSAEVGEASGNGGTAVISTTVSDVLYFYLGQGTGETGSLEILSGGSLTTTGTGGHYVGQYGNGYLTVAGGNLSVSAGHLYVGFSNPNGYGKVVQTGGSVSVAQDVYLSEGSTTTGRYELSGGTVSANRLLVGLRGVGTFVQTSGSVVVRTTTSANVTIGYYNNGVGTYEIRGGTISATRINNGLALSTGHGGIGLMRVVGDAATIEATTFYQNERSTLEMHVGNGGVSRIQVSGTATLRPGAQLDMGLAGGAALLTTKTFDLLTANNIIDGMGAVGTFTLAGPEPLWDISQSSTLVRATLAGAGLGPVAANYDTFVELEVDGGDGSLAGYATVTDLSPGRTFWALLDVRKDGAALAGTALVDLAEYIESAGHTVYATHPILDSGCGVTGEYNLMFDLDVLSETAHFAWDFSEYDSTLRVANLALGVPEPSTFLLTALGLLSLAFGGRRRGRGRRMTQAGGRHGMDG